MTQKHKGFISVIFSVFLWSLWPVALKVLPFDAFSTSVITLFGGSLFGMMLFPAVERKKFTLFKKKFGFFLLASFVLLLNMFFYFEALSHSAVSLAVITHYTAPVFVAVLSPIVIGEKRKRHVFLSIALSMAGLSLCFFPWKSGSGFSVYGAAMGLLSGFFYGFGVVLVKFIMAEFSAIEYLFFSSLISFPVYFPVFLARFHGSFSGRLFHTLFLLSLFMSFIPAISYLYGLKRLSAQTTSIVSYLEPVLAISWGILVFGEPLTFNIALGGFLVFVSGYLVIKEE